MKQNFLDLWNSLSKSGIIEKALQSKLLGIKVSPLPPKLSAKISNYPGFKNRNPFQVDLKILSDLILEDLPSSEDLEEVFLKQCYQYSGAIPQHSLISKEILRTRYLSLIGSNQKGPTLISAVNKKGISQELLGESLSQRPMLIIGDVGVGKTTFIRNLIKIEASDLMKNSYTFHINLGIKASLSPNIREFILDDIAEQLLERYSIDIKKDKFIRGVYHSNLLKFPEGVYGRLKEVNPEKYLEKQINYLESLIGIKDKHVRSSLEHLSKAHKKQIVLFLDNVDQRSDNEQQDTFLIAQELAYNWPLTVFLSLRPETFHKSLKTGTLSAYHPKAFTISPPRVDRVISSRLNFGKSIAKGELKSSILQDNILTKLNSLSAILEVFINSIDNDPIIIEAIDNISGGNIRRALDLVRDFFGSGHVDTEKIVNIFFTQGTYYIPLHEFLRAVIFGDSEYYDPSSSPVPNLFDIFSNDPKEHFLHPILLKSIDILSKISAHGQGGFVEFEKILSAVQEFGFIPDQIELALSRSCKKQLVNISGDRTDSTICESSHSFRISTLGIYAIENLIKRFVYIDAIKIDTPILIESYRESIYNPKEIHSRLDTCENFCSYLTEQWNLTSLKNDIFDWITISDSILTEISKIYFSLTGHIRTDVKDK